MTPLDYQLAIIRAEKDGFWAFANALRQLYLRDYPIKVPALQTTRPALPGYFVSGIRCGDFSGCSQ